MFNAFLRRPDPGSSCGCRAPGAQARERSRGGVVRAARGLRESVEPHRPKDVEPIILMGGPGTKCRPFLKIEKDTEKFAACNALADELGPINTPEKAFKLIGEAIGSEVNEVFGVATLDIHLRLKSIAETGRGEPDSVMAPLMPTLQAALMDGAHAVILFHCHPSGIKAEPSDADIETTEAFAEAFDTVNIKLIDHVITGGDGRRRSYYSFLQDGRL